MCGARGPERVGVTRASAGTLRPRASPIRTDFRKEFETRPLAAGAPSANIQASRAALATEKLKAASEFAELRANYLGQ